MIKKGFNILIVTITSLLLLAHAVVPHHHHNLEVCIVNLPSHSHDYPNDDHQNCGENHNHEHNHSDDLTCILEKIVMFRPGNSEQDDEFISAPESETNFFFIVLFSNPEKNESYSAELNNTSPPDLEKNYTAQAAKTFGLRAPPVV